MMKKRFVSLLLAALFGFACALPAFAAEGFDESVLQNAEGVICDGDETTRIYHMSGWNDHWSDLNEKGEGVNIFPQITVTNDKSVFEIVLNADFNLDSGTLIEELYLGQQVYLIGDKYYFFFPDAGYTDDGYTGLKYVKDSGETWFIMGSWTELDAGSLALMDAMEQHSNEEILFIMPYQDTIAGLRIEPDFTNDFVYLYNLYKQAGGLSEANLAKMPAGSGTEYSFDDAQ